ncbi:MAG: adenylyltransferase/cytidyltransferase family protein, partial [Patescibacteria group bacterium]
MQTLGAKIVSLEEFKQMRPNIVGTIVATSGPFDPIHPGHISCIMESKKHGDNLVVVVNGDWFCKNKKGKPFQDLMTRCMIVSAISGVDYVIPFEIEGDMTACQALEIIQ